MMANGKAIFPMGGSEQLVSVNRASHIYNREVEGHREVSRLLHDYTMLMQSSVHVATV